MADSRELAQEQELNLIGALLKDPSKLDYVKEIIVPDDIWLVKARWCYESMLALRDNGMTIDTVTVGDELERHNHLDEWGGRLALQRVRENFRGDAPESYAAKVLDYSAKRHMVEAGGLLATWGSNGRDSWTMRADIIRRLTDIRTPNNNLDAHTVTMSDGLSSAYDKISNGRADFLPTGLYDLDKLFYGGFLPSDLTVIAGRPGTGKTSLMLSIAKYAADKNKRGLFESLEMSNEQVIMRLISMETGISYGALITGKLTRDEWIKINAVVEDMEKMPLHFNDMPSITVNGIRQNYIRESAKHGRIDFIVVDYLQLQGADGKYQTREAEVASVSRGLKAMAKEFNVPVIAGAQLSRAIEQRSEKRPVLSDLRESGAIEQDCDNIIFIHKADEKSSSVELITAKHRNGATGGVDVIFRKEFTRFENLMRGFAAESE
jgi:replicative DNA helicase